MNRTLLLLKPDGVKLELMQSIVSEMQGRGLWLVESGEIYLNESVIRNLYKKYQNAWFFRELINYLSEDVSILSVWEGDNAQEIAAEIKGSSYDGTGVRGKWSSCELENYEGKRILLKNILHVSDPENFDVEYALLHTLLINDDTSSSNGTI